MGRHHRGAGTSRSRVRIVVGLGAGVLPLVAPALASAETVPAPVDPPDAAVSETPCAATAKACVDISRQKAWLTDGHGHIVYGAVPVRTGAPKLETPTGTFGVMWKDKDHRSGQYPGADMRNSVFFAPGDAFHEGSLDRDSAGCVHLAPAASQRFFDYLQPYDEVQILP